jgi:pyocin large subunit-like protein
VARCKIALSLGLALVLAACERPSAVAKQEEPAAATASMSASAPQSARQQAQAPARQIDGKPIWSASRRGSAEENAQRAFERNGEAFGAKDLDDFVRKAHAFIDKPPPGTERLARSNGDVLLYDGKNNVFAVATREGAPRTMFKPDEGAAYWQEQKDREGRRTAQGGERENGDT